MRNCNDCECRSFCCLIAEWAGLLRVEKETCEKINGNKETARKILYNLFSQRKEFFEKYGKWLEEL